MKRHKLFAAAVIALVAAVALSLLLARGAHHGHAITTATGAAGPVGAPATFGVLAPNQAPPTTSTAPTSRMYDDVNLGLIPSNAGAVAGYVAGSWPTFSSLAGRWPKAVRVSITPNASHVAKCLDVEPGDATPQQVFAWVEMDLRAGVYKPCVYASISEWSEITPYLASIPRSDYLKWDAWYTGVAHLDSGYDATQWTDVCNGASLDCSQATKAFLTLTKPKNPLPHPASYYSIFPKQQFKIGKQHLSERNQVEIFDRRPNKQSQGFMSQLAKRLYNVSCLKNGKKLKKCTWGLFHRGTRYQRLGQRIYKKI